MTTEADVYDALKYHVVEDENGTRRYYNGAGQLHREDGPAQVGSDGTKLWCINGKYHRVSGPAIEWHNGMKYWFLHGTCLTKQQHHVRLGELGLA